MVVIVKNKASLNVTVSPWIKRRVEEISDTPDFASVSDVVSQALSEFLARYDDRKKSQAQRAPAHASETATETENKIRELKFDKKPVKVIDEAIPN
jgi:Arc/MetJ-type ribon-helix-helix transcriptional regulator